MSVFRIEKTNNYTVMSNHHLKDIKLSYRAKGLLSFMLSLPDDWDYSVSGLAKVSKESIKAIRSTLKELEDMGYLVRTRIQLDNGRFDYEYAIYETPYTQKGHAVDGYTLEDTQINTKEINIKEQDKIDKTINLITKELINRNFIEINDLDLYRYDELFSTLLQEYEYKEIIISSKYVIERFRLNNGLDENNNPIKDKFNYFKNSLINNLIKMNNEIDFEWD